MKRKRCTDEKFLEAVFTSTTYKEVAQKTGQTEKTTAARYLRTRKMLEVRGVELPKMYRKPPETQDTTDRLVNIVTQLRLQYGKD